MRGSPALIPSAPEAPERPAGLLSRDPEALPGAQRKPTHRADHWVGGGSRELPEPQMGGSRWIRPSAPSPLGWTAPGTEPGAHAASCFVEAGRAPSPPPAAVLDTPQINHLLSDPRLKFCVSVCHRQSLHTVWHLCHHGIRVLWSQARCACNLRSPPASGVTRTQGSLEVQRPHESPWDTPLSVGGANSVGTSTPGLAPASPCHLSPGSGYLCPDQLL